MNIALTGATGFIGRHVLTYLLQHTPHFVTILVRDACRAKEVLPAHDRLQLVEGDLQDHREDWMELLGQPDRLIHLAWSGLPNYWSWHHIDTNLPSDIRFIHNLEQHGLRDITVTGTCLEYGQQEGMLCEDMAALPENPYSIAKDCVRRSLEVMGKEGQMKWKWLRLFYLYGSGQYPGALLPQLQKALDEGKAIFPMSGGEQVRDYLPVEKAAEYIVKTALQDQVTGIVNCCSGNGIKVIDLVKIYLSNQQATIELQTAVHPYPNHEPFAFYGDRSRLDQAIQAYEKQGI